MRPSAVIEVVRCHSGYRILMPTPDPEFLHLQLVRLFCIQSDVDMVESGMILPTGWLSQGVTSPCVVAVNLVAESVASFLKKKILEILGSLTLSFIVLRAVIGHRSSFIRLCLQGLFPSGLSY